MSNFVYNEQNLEGYARVYRKPMKGSENGGDVIIFLAQGYHSRCSVEDSLEGRDGRNWEAGKEGVAVV